MRMVVHADHITVRLSRKLSPACVCKSACVLLGSLQGDV